MKNSSVKVYNVKVKPQSKKEEVVLQDNTLIVKVAALPVEGKANERLIELLCDYFRVPKSAIKILRGETSRNKLVEVAFKE